MRRAERDRSPRTTLRRSRRCASLVGLAGLVVLLAGCASKSQEKAAPPASVTGKRPEAELARVTLLPAAEQRLGLALGKVEPWAAPRTRTLGADVVPSSGRSITISAPVAGRLSSSGPEAHVGQAVKRGDMLVRLTPVASVDRDLHAAATRALSIAESRLTQMEARLARAEKLLSDGAGSARAAEEARADRDTAKAERAAAERRVEILARAPLDADVTVTLRAPEDGLVRGIPSPASALVPAGAPLLELVGTGSLWIRASVFVGDLRRIRPTASARVRPLTAPPQSADPEALPVNGPPTADPASSTFDLYFALPRESDFRPGERVAVTLTYQGEDSAARVPEAAVVRDVHGDAWIYEAVADHAFERRRAEIAGIAGGFATLAPSVHGAPSLKPGTQVVVTGAMELFGFELGAGK